MLERSPKYSYAMEMKFVRGRYARKKYFTFAYVCVHTYIRTYIYKQCYKNIRVLLFIKIEKKCFVSLILFMLLKGTTNKKTVTTNWPLNKKLQKNLENFLKNEEQWTTNGI